MNDYAKLKSKTTIVIIAALILIAIATYYSFFTEKSIISTPVDESLNEYVTIDESLMVLPPIPSSLVFHDNTNTEVGVVTFKDGIITFEGNAEKTAELLFTHFLQEAVDEYIAKKLKEGEDEE